jgi:hypothetical protein
MSASQGSPDPSEVDLMVSATLVFRERNRVFVTSEPESHLLGIRGKGRLGAGHVEPCGVGLNGAGDVIDLCISNAMVKANE